MNSLKYFIALNWFALYFLDAYAVPTIFVDNTNVNSGNRKNAVEDGTCLCGFYELETLDSKELKAEPLVTLINSAHCDFDGFATCHNKCKNATNLLIKKLCTEKRHWITKPGYTSYKFCENGNWIKTGVTISNESLVCCHDGHPISCSLIQQESSFLTDSISVIDIPFLDVESSTSGDVLSIAINFDPVQDVGSGMYSGTEENSEIFALEDFVRVDHNLSPTLSSKDSKIKRREIPKVTTKTGVTKTLPTSTAKTFKNISKVLTTVHPILPKTDTPRTTENKSTYNKRKPCSCGNK